MDTFWPFPSLPIFAFCLHGILHDDLMLTCCVVIILRKNKMAQKHKIKPKKEVDTKIFSFHGMNDTCCWNSNSRVAIKCCSLLFYFLLHCFSLKWIWSWSCLKMYKFKKCILHSVIITEQRATLHHILLKSYIYILYSSLSSESSNNMSIAC